MNKPMIPANQNTPVPANGRKTLPEDSGHGTVHFYRAASKAGEAPSSAPPRQSLGDDETVEQAAKR